MPLPSSDIKEELNRSYVRAVASRAGLRFQWFDKEEGIDAHVQKVSSLPNGRLTPSGLSVQLQLKATETCKVRDGQIVYDIDVDAYNKLVYVGQEAPVLLILYCMPRDTSRWLAHSEDELILRSCCYYWEPPDTPTENASTKRISIPQTQVLNPDTFPDLVEALRERYLRS